MPEERLTKALVSDYINKVTYLEERLGTKTHFKILDPFPIRRGRDIIAIQSAAKKIAEFIGLQDVSFIVAITKQEENVGGHIDLKNSEKDVFIEISETLLKFNDAILSTLAHEIAHKYLHVNGIWLDDEYENEVLTDIATIYLGLGKLTMNGCECKNVREEFVPPDTTKTITETQKTGYLQRCQFAFIYRVVCGMRKISERDSSQKLSSDAVSALKQCDKKYSKYYRPSLHDEQIKENRNRSIDKEIKKIQEVLATLDNNLRLIEKACMDDTSQFLKTSHQRIHQVFLVTRLLNRESEPNISLRFLKLAKHEQRVTTIRSELRKVLSEARKYNNGLREISGLIKSNNNIFLKLRSNMMNVVKCYNDGTKIRLPENQAKLSGKCPKCNYHFVADTSTPKIKKIMKTKAILNLLIKKWESFYES